MGFKFHDIQRGQWLALAAALLGWMFDGFEQGLFPLAARPALGELLGTQNDEKIGLWIAVATAGSKGVALTRIQAWR